MAMIYVFKNTRTVIRAEKILAASGLSVEIVPTPRTFSSECGMCIQVSDTNSGTVDTLLQENALIYNKHKWDKGRKG